MPNDARLRSGSAVQQGILMVDGRDPGARMRDAPQRRGGRKRGGKLIPLLILALFALFIATQEVPQVRDWVEGILSPDKAAMRKACHEAAFAVSRQSDFARLIESGEIESTQEGYLVREVVMGEMGQSGNEIHYEVSCYLDRDGQLVRTYRQDVEASP